VRVSFLGRSAGNATSNNPGYEPEYQVNTVHTLQLVKTTFRVWEGREKRKGKEGESKGMERKRKGRGKEGGEGKEERVGGREGEREKGGERQRRLIVNHSGVAKQVIVQLATDDKPSVNRKTLVSQ